ncbi:hypothetical protein JCM11641_007125 [Rhodosporidiobolus odoratus]
MRKERTRCCLRASDDFHSTIPLFLLFTLLFPQRVRLWPYTDLLSLPPSLFSPSPHLRRIPAIAALHWHNQVPHGRNSGYASFVAGSTLAREAWEEVRAGDDFLSSVLPPAIGLYDLPTLLPAPTPPTTFAFSFLFLPHAFSAGEARRQLALAPRPLPLSSALASLFSIAPDDGALEDMWRWIGRKPATAREVDVHWRLAHGGTITAKSLHRLGKLDSPACVFCGAEDSVTHSFFTCHYSAEYWEETIALLATSISPNITSTSFSPAKLVLGLSTLSSAVNKSVLPTLRAIVAIAFSTINGTRRSRIRPDPALTSPSPTSLASRSLVRLETRLLSAWAELPPSPSPHHLSLFPSFFSDGLDNLYSRVPRSLFYQAVLVVWGVPCFFAGVAGSTLCCTRRQVA